MKGGSISAYQEAAELPDDDRPDGFPRSTVDDPNSWNVEGVGISPVHIKWSTGLPPTLPVLYPDVPHDVYHSDPWGPSLSQSTANVLLSCPVKAYHSHPRLGGRPKATTDAMDLGSIAHELVLGKGAGFSVLDYPDFRTKAAQEARDEARAEGKVPVLLKAFSAAQDAANEVLVQADGRFAGGDYEQTILWREGKTLCRCRLDHLRIGKGWGAIADLKWLRSADPKLFQRNMVTNGHDIQAVAYVAAVEAVYPELAGRVSFSFILVEQGPPVVVQEVKLAGSMRSLGQQRWKRATKLWQKCLDTGHWPGYYDGVAEIEAMPWQLTDDLAQAVQIAGDPTEAWGEGDENATDGR